MPKSVAIVTPVFPPYRGGMGRVAETDALQLAALGYDVRVYAPGLKDARRGALPYGTRRLHCWPRYGNGGFAPFAAGLFRTHDAVLLHYPFFGVAEPLAFFRPQSRKSKFLLMYHMDAVVVPPLFAPGLALHRSQVMPRIVAAADRVLVTSADYARASHIAPFFRAHPERFSELAPAVDVARFSPGTKDKALLERYGLTQYDRIITLVGGLDKAHYFKGVPTLLRALATSDLAEAQLVIVGQGELRPKYEEYARLLGIADRVRFAGSVSEEELAAHHRLGDVFAFPSVDRSEAFGIAALEALACGVPVVASDLPGVRTIVRDGETGLRTPVGSASALAVALARLLNDEPRRQAFGVAGRAMVVAAYSLEARQARWVEVMAQTL